MTAADVLAPVLRVAAEAMLSDTIRASAAASPATTTSGRCFTGLTSFLSKRLRTDERDRVQATPLCRGHLFVYPAAAQITRAERQRDRNAAPAAGAVLDQALPLRSAANWATRVSQCRAARR